MTFLSGLHTTKKWTVTPDLESISQVNGEIRLVLEEWKVAAKNISQTRLILEELLVKMVQGADEGEKIHVNLIKSYKKIYVRLICRGKEITIDDAVDKLDLASIADDLGPEAEDVVRDIILRATSDRLGKKYHKGINKVRFLIQSNDNAMAIDTLLSIALAFVVGITMRMFLPESITHSIADNLFMPLYDIFIRGIQIIMAPLVFFSLASSMSGFSDFGSLGRSGAKVVGFYTLTTLIAILLAFGVNAVFDPGSMPGLTLPTSTGDIDTSLGNTKISLIQTLVNIVPDNFLGAFVHADLLQVIFLAILTGLAVGKIGKYSEPLREGIESLNALFSTMTSYIVRFMPLAVFGAIAYLVITVDVAGALPLAAWAGTMVLTFALMLLVYPLLIFITTGLNPINYYRKFSRAFITALSTASSSATLPVSLECCNKLGISSRIYSFSIPLGATINMDGASISMTSCVLFLASLYGMSMDAHFITTLIITTMLLSMASPGVPGAAPATLLILIHQLGIPDAGYALLVGILPLLDNFETTVNVTGDGAVTTIVANSEKLLNRKVFNG